MHNNRTTHFPVLLFGALVIANLGAVCWFWGASSGALLNDGWGGGGPALALGRLSGLLLQLALLLQLILIGRVAFIERALGFDRLARLHRILGFSLVALVVLHPLLISMGYAPLREEPLAPTFVAIVNGFDDVLRALVGAVMLLSVAALSVPWVRRKLRYEAWHAAHLMTYAAIAVSFGHQIGSGGDFINRSFVLYWYVLNGVVGAAFFGYRFLRPFLLWQKHRFTVDRVVQEASDVWSVYITGRDLERFSFAAGQFAYLHLLTRGLWAGHPFSFSREYDGRAVRFSIKALGPSTKLIASLRPGVRVIVDGPLGVFTAHRASTDRFLLIGGGIGVTPLRAIAGELASRRADIVALYGIRDVRSAALTDELRTLVPGVHLFISDPAEPLPPGAHRGQIDAAAIRQFAPDVAERDVYVCGPSLMMDAICDALRVMGVPERRIHVERFAF